MAIDNEIRMSARTSRGCAQSIVMKVDERALRAHMIGTSKYSTGATIKLLFKHYVYTLDPRDRTEHAR
jgi:hypothetical protein